MDKAASVEKRRYKRFTVQDGTFAALRNHDVTLGIIKDISQGGFAVHYIVSGNLLHCPVTIDALFKRDICYLQGVPVKIISDLEVDDRPAFSSIPTRRCGMQFQEMTPSLKSQVEGFIEKFAL